MLLRNFLLLLIFVVLISCNQTDSSNQAQSTDQNKSEADLPVNSESEDIDENKGKVLALVNGSPIYEDDLKSGSLEFAITDEILYQVGLKQGIDEQNKDKIKDYEKMIVLRSMKVRISEDAEPMKKISDEEIEDYYNRNKDKYTNFRIHEISFSDTLLAEDIKEKAQGGMDLIDIVNSYPDKDITLIDVGYNREMAQNFNNKEVGSITDVIRKPDGTYSIMKIVDIREIPLKTSKNSIKHILQSRKEAQFIHDYTMKLAQENDIEVEIVTDKE